LRLEKFRNNDSSWREHIQRVEEEIMKDVVRYTVQEDDRERGKLRDERE
jgi:hypothetical protein